MGSGAGGGGGRLRINGGESGRVVAFVFGLVPRKVERFFSVRYIRKRFLPRVP